MKKNLSVILPTYNEVENIGPLIDAIIGALEKDLHEIIVVDDNSPDLTWRIVEDMIKTGKYPSLRLERRLKDRGLTNSICRGIELAKGDAVAWMDCDFSLPPKYLPVLLSLINADYDIAVGSRFVLGGRWKTERREPEDTIVGVVLSRILNLVIQICLDHRFKDYTSGFVVARKDVFNKIKLRGDYGEYFIDFIYSSLKLNYRVVEVPYVWRRRRAGHSKTALNLKDYFRRGWKYLATTLRLILTRKFD